MPNFSKPIETEAFNIFMDYPFSDSPFKGITEEQLPTLPLKKYRQVLNQMWKKIQDQIVSKQDESLFFLIRENISCNSFESFLEDGPFDLNINPKTLRNCIIRKAGAERIVSLFKAFKIIREAELEEFGNLSRVAGHYNIYNLHNTNKEKFQVSNLQIALEENKSEITFISRKHRKESKALKIEAKGTDKLLISLKEDNFVLIFYAFIGALDRPKVIQSIYLYNNGHGHTIGGLAILQRVKNESSLALPKRGLNNLDEIQSAILKDCEKYTLQRFLLNRSTLLKPKLFNGYTSDQPLQFEFTDLDLFPGAFKEKALFFKNSEGYVGQYYIYFNERYPSVDIKEKAGNNFYSTVGEGLLEIYHDELSRALKCRMKTKKNKKGEVIIHEGNVINNELNSLSYLILSLYEKSHKSRYINLILMKSGSDLLFGSHNIMYSKVGKLGVGSAVVVKAEEGYDFETKEPKVVFPCKEYKTPLYDSIVNYLSRNSNALLKPITSSNELRAYGNINFRGTYKMYSYGKGGIRIGVLHIHKSGFVEHYGISGDTKTTAFGYITQVRTVLNIVLKNVTNNRTGFCSIKVGEIAPETGDKESNGYSEEKSKTIYVGTFAGVTRRKGEFPLASTIILEFMGKIEGNRGIIPDLIGTDEPEYQNIPKAIQKALRFKNQSIIGFLDQQRGIFNLSDLTAFNNEKLNEGKVYLDAALKRIPKATSEEVNKLKIKAKKHGIEDFDEQVYKYKEKEAQSYIERAIYHALIKNDADRSYKLYEKSCNLSSTPDQFRQQFEQEIEGSTVYEKIKGKL